MVTAADIRRAEALGRKLKRIHAERFQFFTYNRLQKKCNTCGCMKVMNQYPQCASNADGRSSRCKDCTRKYNLERKRAHR